MIGLEYRIRDLENGDKDISLSLSGEQLTDALHDLGVDLQRSAATVTAQLIKLGNTVQCNGSVGGALTLQCQRCLEPAQLPLDVKLHTIYTEGPGTAAASLDGEAVADETDVEDVDYAHHDGDIVDLWPLLREELILSLPLTVLCREDCRGLCPTCGIDLNTSSCTCQPAPPLSPFAGLRSIKLPT
jgi:uncharacterized protein